VIKNALIQSLVALLKKKPVSTSEKRFLVVSTTALGDTLWATPAIRALRHAFPSSYIGMLVSPIGKEVLAHNPYVDELFVVKSPAIRSLIDLYSKMKEQCFSHVFVFHTSQRPVLPFAALLGAPHIIGTKGINKGLDSLLTKAHPLDAKMHEIERRLQIVAEAGAEASSYDMDLFLHPQDEEQANGVLYDNTPVIALHPGAKDPFRRWPASHFIALGKQLRDRLKCRVLITGVPSEKDLVEEIASHIEGAVAVTHLPLRSFAALVKKMRVIVTNDTGPMHVALAMKTPLVCLFAPSDPDRFGPYRVPNATIIAKGATCTPCLQRKCPSSFCFLQIGVSEVYDAALELSGLQ
jgi:ADP-heptose:LPS heptosyltransferase